MPIPGFHQGERNRLRDKWVINHVSVSFLEYPLECVLAAWGIISGFQVALNVITPSVAQLPHPLPIIWGILMFSGGVYTIVGLRRKAYSTLVSSGLNIMGYVLAAWATAILAFADISRAITVVLLLFGISLIAFVRSWWLRARSDLLTVEFDRGGDGHRKGSDTP